MRCLLGALIVYLACIGSSSGQRQGARGPILQCNDFRVEPNPLVVGKVGTLSCKVSNVGDMAFVGMLGLTWTNLQTGRIDDLPGSYFEGSLKPGESKLLSHTSTAVKSNPGRYLLRLVEAEGIPIDRCEPQVFSVTGENDRADLMVANLELPATMVPGEKVVVNVSIQNRGLLASKKSLGCLLWDKKPSLSVGAKPLGGQQQWVPIPGGKTVKQAFEFTLPEDFPNGQIHLFYKIDVDQRIDELDEYNNVKTAAATASYRLVLGSGIELSGYPSLQQGAAALVAMTVKNKGKGHFSGTFRLSLLGQNGEFLSELARWEDCHVDPDPYVAEVLPAKATLKFNFPTGTGYRIVGSYKSHTAWQFTQLAEGECDCENPFEVEIVQGLNQPTLPRRKPTMLPSPGSRTPLRISW